jgi:hypothetical protein
MQPTFLYAEKSCREFAALETHPWHASVWLHASTFCQTQGPVSEAWACLPLSLRPRNFLEKEMFHGLHGNREPLPPPVCSHESLYSQNVKYSNRMMTIGMG